MYLSRMKKESDGRALLAIQSRKSRALSDPLLVWLASHFGGGVCEQKHTNPAWKTTYYWQRKQRSASSRACASS